MSTMVATTASPRRGVGSRAASRPTAAGHAGGTSGVYVRRRIVVLAWLVVVAFALTVAIGRVGAEAELADAVAGSVVVEPGGTLWDIAVATAPDGVDPRQQLRDLRSLNGITGSHVDAWSVVLLPAR